MVFLYNSRWFSSHLRLETRILCACKMLTTWNALRSFSPMTVSRLCLVVAEALPLNTFALFWAGCPPLASKKDAHESWVWEQGRSLLFSLQASCRGYLHRRRLGVPVACCSESFVLFGTCGTPGRRKLLFCAFFFFCLLCNMQGVSSLKNKDPVIIKSAVHDSLFF